jgi:hypothetical protein
MNSFTDVSAKQLRHAASIKERIDELERELSQILGTSHARTGGSDHSPAPRRTGKRRMSAAGRAAIAAGARARWAKIKGTATKSATTKPKRKMSAAGRARLSALAKARWKKARAAGRATL